MVAKPRLPVRYAEQLHRQLLQRCDAESDAVFEHLEGIRWRTGNQPYAYANANAYAYAYAYADADADADAYAYAYANAGRS